MHKPGAGRGHGVGSPRPFNRRGRRCLGATAIILGLAWAGLTALGVVSFVMATDAEPSTAPDEADCDPLDTNQCVLPFPSSHYLVPDPRTDTGVRVSLGPKSLPATRWGHVDPSAWNENDGFSTTAPLLFSFAAPAALDNVATWERQAWSTLGNASTVLLDGSGNMVPHYVDRDAYDQSYGPPRVPLLVLQPSQALRHNETYVVGIRALSPLGGSGGTLLQPSTAFKALRDDDAGGAAKAGISASRRARFEGIVFPRLAAAGVPRGDLQLAWEFTTISKRSSLSRHLHMRDTALGVVGREGPAYVIDKVDTAACPTTAAGLANTTIIGRTIWGHAMIPSFLTTPGPGVHTYMTNASGTVGVTDGVRSMPSQNGLTRTNFVMRVPCTLLVGQRPARLLLQYGHGLFGSRAEVKDSYLSHMANAYGWVLIASDWDGMSKWDVPNAMRLFLVRASEFRAIPERTAQGFVNKACLLRMALGRMTTDANLKTYGAAGGGSGAAPVPLLSHATPYGYYGNSQGSVVGGGYFGFSSDHTHAALGVPGTPFALLLSRSKDFALYYSLFKLQMWSERDVRIFISVMQQLWDPSESAGWLNHVATDASKHVVMQAAMGDAQVTVLAAHFMARSYGAFTIVNQTRPVFGLTQRAAPFANASAITEWHYLDVGPIPTTDTPPNPATDTHECPRRERRGQDQIRDFMEQGGLVVQHCHPVCQSATCPKGDSAN